MAPVDSRAWNSVSRVVVVGLSRTSRVFLQVLRFSTLRKMAPVDSRAWNSVSRVVVAGFSRASRVFLRVLRFPSLRKILLDLRCTPRSYDGSLRHP